MTLGESLLSVRLLPNMIQLEWWLVLIKGSPLLLDRLRTFQISDHGGSWIKMMLKSFWVSSSIWTMIEFFRTFCDKILRDLKIIVSLWRSLLNRWTSTCFHRSQNTFSSAIPYWNGASRRGIHLSWLGGRHSSSSIWTCRGKGLLSLFQVSESWSYRLLCSTIRTLCDSLTCADRYTWHIWSPVFCTRRWCVPISSNSYTRGSLGSCLLPW